VLVMSDPILTTSMNRTILETIPDASHLRTCFHTTDFDVATYLYSRGYPLKRIDESGEILMFTFPPEASLSAEAFFQGATVTAKAILHAARELDFIRTHKTYECYNV
jgi:hypothetical protein